MNTEKFRYNNICNRQNVRYHTINKHFHCHYLEFTNDISKMNKKIQKYVNERVTNATAIPKIDSIITKYKIRSNIFLQFAESLENFII